MFPLEVVSNGRRDVTAFLVSQHFNTVQRFANVFFIIANAGRSR
jgi:hypothetical protein